MDMPSLSDAPARAPLLGPHDPPVFTIANPQGRAAVLLTADHAGRAFPAALDRLGLQAGTLARHVAYDIGVERMTRRLAELLDARAVLHGYSRLLIDPNRPPDDPTSICRVSDGVVIPGNRGLTPAGRRDRIEMLFAPYHQAIDAELSALMAPGPAPALVSLHSFTPSFRGYPRPWHVGVLWDGEDDRLARPLMRELSRDPEIVVGDNQPYSGRGRHGYTVETHAQSRGLANALIEVRQDLIAEDDGADAWADRLAQALRPALAAARQASVAPESEAASGQ
jgi:predicted N-formylglutamate amidohydrolase